MMDEEREAQLGSAIRDALGAGPSSTTDARARVMSAVRAAAAAPTRDVQRPAWRSPAFGLLAAASIAGIVAVVHSRGISYTPEPVPGIDVPAVRSDASSPAVARTVGEASEVAAVHVQFVLVAPRAKSVSVVGDFNDWNPSAIPLQPARGVWSVEAVVPVGRHDYAFVIDGTRWIADPAAPRAPADEFGAGYSVLLAGARP
jgi:hypothetical protein